MVPFREDFRTIRLEAEQSQEVCLFQTKQCGLGDDGHSPVIDKCDTRCLGWKEQKLMRQVTKQSLLSYVL